LRSLLARGSGRARDGWDQHGTVRVTDALIAGHAGVQPSRKRFDQTAFLELAREPDRIVEGSVSRGYRARRVSLDASQTKRHTRSAGLKMSAITFRTAWRRNDEDLQRDAKAFWQSHTRLPANVTPDERARELCAVAFRDDSAVGVSTATVELIPQFRCHMAVYRCSVAKGFLALPPLSWSITDYSRTVLEQWSLENPGEKVMGLFAVVQARALIERYPHIVGPAQMNFAGFTPAGFPVRVAWFRHATIPAEWPPRPLRSRVISQPERAATALPMALDRPPKSPGGDA